MSGYDTCAIDDTEWETAGNGLITLLVQTRLPHHQPGPCPAGVVDSAHTPAVDDTGRCCARLAERARMNLGGRGRIRGQVSAKVADSHPVRWGSKRYSGPQRIRNGDRHFRRVG